MRTTVDYVADADGVAVLALEGELDASNYQDVIAQIRELVGGGTRRLVLDLAGLSYMASSGLVALHSAALLLRGIDPPDPEAGWGAFHSLGLDVSSAAPDPNVRLVAPQPSVDRVLERTGLKGFFPVHPDRASAIASL